VAGAPEEMNTTTFFNVLPGPVTVSSVICCLGFNLTHSGCLDMSMTCDFGGAPVRVTFPEIVPSDCPKALTTETPKTDSSTKNALIGSSEIGLLLT
jgi:hypothetical protein